MPFGVALSLIHVGMSLQFIRIFFIIFNEESPSKSKIIRCNYIGDYVCNKSIIETLSIRTNLNVTLPSVPNFEDFCASVDINQQFRYIFIFSLEFCCLL